MFKRLLMYLTKELSTWKKQNDSLLNPNESYFNISLNADVSTEQKDGDLEQKMRDIAQSKKSAFYDNLFVERFRGGPGNQKRTLRLSRNFHSRSISKESKYDKNNILAPLNNSLSKVNDTSFFNKDASWKIHKKK